MIISKGYRFILFLAIAIMFMQIICYGDDTFDRTIRIAGDNNYPPYEYIDTSGIYKGFNVDIMHAIAIEMKLDIEIMPMAWDDAFVLLQNGEVDVIQGMLKTKEREGKYSFSKKLVSSTQVIFVNKDQNNIVELSDLDGLKVSTQLGDVGSKIIESIDNVHAVSRENQELAMMELINGNVDAMVGNRLTGLYIIQKNKEFDKIKIVGEPLYSVDYCCAVKNGNDEMLDIINKGIEAIKLNGTYDKIYNKWFGEVIVDKELLWRKKVAAIFTILIIVLFVLIVIFYWNRNLKKAVNLKTFELVNANENLKLNQLYLERSNRLNGRILENTLDGIIVLNQDGTIAAFNSVANNILSNKLESCKYLFGSDLKFSSLYKGFLQACKGKAWKEELEICSDDGLEIISLECVFTQIKVQSGEIDSILLTLHDLTESKRLKEALLRSDKMRSLGTMAAEMAHELRNPLTAMKAFVDMIPFKFSDERFRKEAVNVLNTEMQRLTDITKVLLDYTKQRTRKPTLFDFNEIINEVLVLLHSSLRQHNIKLTYDCGNIYVYADKNQINQVIVNLIINSIDAIKQNGNIKIVCISKDSIVSIIITDDGCGIAKDDIKKVFDPFFTRKNSGYGLGLSICYQLIKENNGDIYLKNNDFSKGIEVVIKLPASTTEDIK